MLVYFRQNLNLTIICFVLALGYEPDFIYPLENVTIPQGRDATFTCVVNNLGGYRVSAGGDPSQARVCKLNEIIFSRWSHLSCVF
jgi:hypothetical protein